MTGHQLVTWRLADESLTMLLIKNGISVCKLKQTELTSLLTVKIAAH